MSLSNIDKTQALRTEDELRALVEAIHASPPATQETNWLEWKSTLNLGTPEARFAVAKAILGFANRSVAQAQLALEGVAYMVVGVEPGAATGVPAFDHATLGQRIKTYADGPRWNPHYVEYSGVTVLVIVVETPRAGDPIHALQKAFSNDKTRLVFHHSGDAPYTPSIENCGREIRFIIVVTVSEEVSEEPVTAIPTRNALRPIACHQAWRNAGS